MLFFALDLATSPFHHHTHDGGKEVSAVQDHVEIGFDESIIHIEPAERHPGHSLAILIQRVPEAAPTIFFVEPLATVLLAVLDSEESRATAMPAGAPDHVPIPSAQFSLPVSRAPPVLHA